MEQRRIPLDRDVSQIVALRCGVAPRGGTPARARSGSDGSHRGAVRTASRLA